MFKLNNLNTLINNMNGLCIGVTDGKYEKEKRN